MNASSFGSALRDSHTLVSIRWDLVENIDAHRMRVTAYEADPQGTPLRNGDASVVESRLSGMLIRSTSPSGGGALLAMVRRMMEDAVQGALDTRHLRHIVQRIDAALFALDHDGGHGLEVEGAVRELWALSGPDTWAGYAAKRTDVLKWLAAFAREPIR